MWIFFGVVALVVKTWAKQQLTLKNAASLVVHSLYLS